MPNALRADGVDYAKLMMLVGRGDNFQVKPYYEENYAFARALTDELNARIPGICRDVLVKCIKFVLPEDLDISGGSTQVMCNPRSFKARFIAHNIDSDFRCCESVLTL